MAFSETFLFELSVNLSRNGCSLSSSSYLRSAYSELTSTLKYGAAGPRLRSITTLRQAVILYLSLVIKGLPLGVSTCAKCVLPDGSLLTICFDGLQLGYKVKYKRPFQRTSVSTSAIPRASTYAHIFKDSGLAKALGSVFNSSAKEPVGSAKTITNISSMRGHVMGVGALLDEPPPPVTESVDVEEKKQSTAKRGWCPVQDGGAARAFFIFFQRFFRCDILARALCVQIAAANGDMRRRVPARHMTRVSNILSANVIEPAVVIAAGETQKELLRRTPDVPLTTQEHHDTSAGAGKVSREGAALAATAGAKDIPGAAKEGPSSLDGRSDSEALFASEQSGDESSSCERLSEEEESPGTAPYWDSFAPLVRFAELLSEPALADTGGEKGVKLNDEMMFRLQADIPTTAAATLKIADFVRALTVDPFVVWAPGGQRAAVDAIVEELHRPNSSVQSLSSVLRRPDVSNLRLLRSAVACLGPALIADPSLRRVFSDVLSAVKDTAVAYDTFVLSSQEPVADDPAGGIAREDGEAPRTRAVFSKEGMASAHPMERFTPMQFEDTWLKQPASVQSYREAYHIPEDHIEDVLQTGVWAPSFPVLRPMNFFDGGAAAATDEPDCSHRMGEEKKYTGGTFGVFCTCQHPKCLAVVVLDGSEGQRMPIEFIVQRCAKMPKHIIYDFGCATLKMALCRLPWVGRVVSFLVDRFHWRKNHVFCSKAMNPDSYDCMDRVNTSSSEERNALSRRQEHHLRLMNQDNFITFTTYQQALANVIAMHRDTQGQNGASKWPRWYKEKYVDGVGHTERNSAWRFT
ncbi:hypothetical protein I4F81_001757 [Pyropia yezoensis]|uniref:Uncharacterized protein n=1 Tax=Pyropia yezoensis TaxID=2788 RepID=A0ACC3BN51_PYRYE|nr:hypothetical protein I4F81_001757 [Neopyropia yezoensis]